MVFLHGLINSSPLPTAFPPETMTQKPSFNPVTILGGFASLLSSALAVESKASDEAKPLGDSGEMLQCFISPTVAGDDVCCILPSLMLKQGTLSSIAATTSLEESASLKLARPLRLCQSKLRTAPITLLGNMSESFMTLIDSRLRSSFSALVRQSQNQSNEALPRVLVGLLASLKTPITSTALVTSFRVLPSVSKRPPNGDYILPLVMEAVIDLSILDEVVSVKIVAPGTIQGTFGPLPGQDMLSKVEIILDTMALLHSMMKQARCAVRKAVTMFSNIAATLVTQKQESVLPECVDSFGRADCSSTKTSSSSSKVCSLMPPPLHRPSSKSLSSSLDDIENLPIESSSDNTSTIHNASWGVVGSKNLPSSDGLLLLTTAAGLKRNRGTCEEQETKNKHPRTEASNADFGMHRKVTSCPNLGNGVKNTDGTII